MPVTHGVAGSSPVQTAKNLVVLFCVIFGFTQVYLNQWKAFLWKAFFISLTLLAGTSGDAYSSPFVWLHSSLFVLHSLTFHSSLFILHFSFFTPPLTTVVVPREEFFFWVVGILWHRWGHREHRHGRCLRCVDSLLGRGQRQESAPSSP